MSVASRRSSISESFSAPTTKEQTELPPRPKAFAPVGALEQRRVKHLLVT